MGTVWVIASSDVTSGELALRAIIGASLSVIVLLFIHVLLRKKLNISAITFFVMFLFILLFSFILLSEAVQSIISTEALL